AHYQGKWLVADLVSLHDIYGKQQQYQVGTPITRTVTLLASNAEDTALADLTIQVPDGFKAYPEKAQRENIVRNGQLVAKLTQTIAMVPSKAGTFTLPEIRVPWWNPHLRKQEYALLPAQVIEVAPAPSQTADLTPVATTPQPQTPAVGPQTVVTAAGYWPLLTGVFALLWLITLILWRRAATQAPRVPHVAVAPNSHSTADTKAVLTQACRERSASRALMALQQHISEQMGSPLSLADIRSQFPELQASIDTLQGAGYSRDSSAPDFDAILKTILAAKVAARRQPTPGLAPLNPH
ncbi:MAG: BatD family protein, partial [Shewanella sp.]|nr:BatD family protein [Shewanella sp.]